MARPYRMSAPSCDIRMTRVRPTCTCAREPIFPGHNVDEKVELIGFGERLRDVGARERASFVGVGDDECASRYFGDEDCWYWDEVSV